MLASIFESGLELKTYDWRPSAAFPKLDELPIVETDALFVPNYFGLFEKPQFAELACDVIEDHTHDLQSNWALSSNADYCVASLRKTLPLPDGGVLWSPKGHQLPSTPVRSEVWDRISNHRLTGMVLKGHYLAGLQIEKNEYLQIASATEAQFSQLAQVAAGPYTTAVLSKLPAASWRIQRQENHLYLANQLLNSIPCIQILSAKGSHLCPLGLVLRFSHAELRASLFRFLIAHNVYPARLWPLKDGVGCLPQVFQQDLELYDTLLLVHCDYRYAKVDLDKIAYLCHEWWDREKEQAATI